MFLIVLIRKMMVYRVSLKDFMYMFMLFFVDFLVKLLVVVFVIFENMLFEVEEDIFLLFLMVFYS